MASTRHDYSELDHLMLQKIAAGGATAPSLVLALDTQIKPFVTKQGEEFRVIDRRLQALRKNGTITCGRVGRDPIWRISAQA